MPFEEARDVIRRLQPGACRLLAQPRFQVLRDVQAERHAVESTTGPCRGTAKAPGPDAAGGDVRHSAAGLRAKEVFVPVIPIPAGGPMRYTVILEREPGGGYVVSVPALPGCVSQGDTRDQALANIKEAAELYLEDCRDAGDPVPPEAGKEFIELDAA